MKKFDGSINVIRAGQLRSKSELTQFSDKIS